MITALALLFAQFNLGFANPVSTVSCTVLKNAALVAQIQFERSAQSIVSIVTGEALSDLPQGHAFALRSGIGQYRVHSSRDLSALTSQAGTVHHVLRRSIALTEDNASQFFRLFGVNLTLTEDDSGTFSQTISISYNHQAPSAALSQIQSSISVVGSNFVRRNFSLSDGLATHCETSVNY